MNHATRWTLTGSRVNKLKQIVTDWLYKALVTKDAVTVWLPPHGHEFQKTEVAWQQQTWPGTFSIVVT